MSMKFDQLKCDSSAQVHNKQTGFYLKCKQQDAIAQALIENNKSIEDRRSHRKKATEGAISGRICLIFFFMKMGKSPNNMK